MLTQPIKYNKIANMMDEEARKRAFENFTPKGNPPVAPKMPRGNAPTDTAMIAQLLDMPRNALQTLLQKVLQAGWGYGSLTGKELLETALKTKDEAYEALKLTALTLAINAQDWREFNALATFWAEQQIGKPKQSIAMEVKDNRIEKMEVDKLICLAKMLDDPVIIAPLPKKIEENKADD